MKQDLIIEMIIHMVTVPREKDVMHSNLEREKRE
jgi:hypothetical protein